MLRVLVVDDSATARELLTHILGGDPEIVIAGTARDGREAIRQAEKLRPDVITMDIHMPGMDGFEATKEIMISVPTPTVIVSASTQIHEVEMGMQALRAGALTMLLKPPSVTASEFPRAARELIETVKSMAEVKVVRHHRRPHVAHRPVLPLKKETPRGPRFRAVAVAASTGGPPALSCLLGRLPKDFPAPILVVQHIAKGFVEGFAEWLDLNILLQVKIARDGERLLPGVVYVASPDRHLGVWRSGHVALSDDPPVDGFRPAATHLFRSVAEAFGDRTVALILTGMGRDGVDGLRHVRDRGGLIVAQNKQSCVVFGMPAAAIAENLADAVLPLDRAPAFLLDLMAESA